MEAVALRAPTVPVRRRTLSTTERNWLLALAIVVGSGLLFWLVGAIEQAATGAPRENRLVWHGAETSMRLLALSHFLTALVFQTTSRSMRSARSRAWFVALLGLGALLCWGYGEMRGAGAWQAQVAAVLFYAYFLVHEFRDEAMFYRAYGDAPGAAGARAVLLVPLFVFGLIASMFVAGAAFRIGGARRYGQEVLDLLGPGRYAVGILPAVLVALAARRAKRRLDADHPGGLAAFVRSNRPILFVFLGIFGVLVADIVVTGRVYAIVTLHVAVWYVFSLHLFRRRARPAPPPRPLTWTWMRSTTAGFNFVHLGLAAVVLACAAVWAYGFRNDPGQPLLRAFLSREAFPFWTIVHVSLSFVPKG